MRHYKKGRKLGTDASHTKAIKKNLAVALFTNDRIKTTVPRAKEARGLVDKIVTWAKKGDLHSRRLAIAALGDKELVREVFSKAEQGMWADRNGGYTRILKLGPRKGDNASMCILELVEEAVEKKASKGGAASAKKEAKKDTKKGGRSSSKKAEKDEKAGKAEEAPAEAQAAEEDAAAAEAPVEVEAAEEAEAEAPEAEEAPQTPAEEAAEVTAEETAGEEDAAAADKAKADKLAADESAGEDSTEESKAE